MEWMVDPFVLCELQKKLTEEVYHIIIKGHILEDVPSPKNRRQNFRLQIFKEC